ncbi:MAG: hypothetical protein MUC97_18390 [Bernardetiaceae bacterium]|jgi:cell division septum initiation protein DivIVA|nr:hypothetical protein [Bernardetiaceae bacterium]
MLEPEVLVFMVPITGILSIAVVKIVRILSGNELPMSKKDLKKLIEEAKNVREYNAELEHRVQNLETIVTSLDTELLEGMINLQTLKTPEQNQQNLQRLAQAIKPELSQNTSQLSPNAPLEDNAKAILNKLLLKIDGLMEQKKATQKRTRGWDR